MISWLRFLKRTQTSEIGTDFTFTSTTYYLCCNLFHEVGGDNARAKVPGLVLGPKCSLNECQYFRAMRKIESTPVHFVKQYNPERMTEIRTGKKPKAPSH